MWNDEAVGRLIEEHWARYRAMTPRDVYKLLYQGVLGPEHLLGPNFADRLRAEYAALPAKGDEPLWEEVRPDGELGRLNLRPFKAHGGDLERLIRACRRTAGQTWGTAEELREVWAVFVEQCRAGRWEVFPLSEVLAFSSWLEGRGYPAVHHSPAYRAAHRPAYRLLARAFWLEMAE